MKEKVFEAWFNLSKNKPNKPNIINQDNNVHKNEANPIEKTEGLL